MNTKLMKISDMDEYQFFNFIRQHDHDVSLIYSKLKEMWLNPVNESDTKPLYHVCLYLNTLLKYDMNFMVNYHNYGKTAIEEHFSKKEVEQISSFLNLFIEDIPVLPSALVVGILRTTYTFRNKFSQWYKLRDDYINHCRLNDVDYKKYLKNLVDVVA